MASSLFNNQTQRNQLNNPINNIQNVMSMLSGKNPQALVDRMMMTNPQFAAFVENNKGKTPEQVAQENGVDLDAIRKYL